MKDLAFLAPVLGKYMVKFGRTKMKHHCKKDLMLKEQAQEIFIRKVILETIPVFTAIKSFLDGMERALPLAERTPGPEIS